MMHTDVWYFQNTAQQNTVFQQHIRKTLYPIPIEVVQSSHESDVLCLSTMSLIL